MGIPKFARFLINRYPLILQKIQNDDEVTSIGSKMSKIYILT